MAVSARRTDRSAYRSRRAGRGTYGLGRPVRLLTLVPLRVRLLVLLVGAIAVSSPWTVPLVGSGVKDLLTMFGVGLLILLILLVGDGWLAVKRPFALTRKFWRLTGGFHLLAIALFGVLALIRPNWGIWDISFVESTLGGEFGQMLVGSVVGVLIFGAVTLGGTSLIWPHATRRGALTFFAVASGVVVGLRDFFAAIVTRTDDGQERVVEKPYVSQWDEDFTHVGASERSGAASAAVVAEEDTGTKRLAEASKKEAAEVKTSQNGLSSNGKGLISGRPAGSGWELPPLDLLSDTNGEKRQIDNEARAQLIIDTLKSFGVDARVVSISQGPTVTQFGIEPGWEEKTRTVMERDAAGRAVKDGQGNSKYRTEVTSRTRIRVNKITSLANDIALALAAPSIRIEAPVPGKPVIGIELPNTVTSLVTLRSVIESPSFRRISTRSQLALTLGKGVSGESVAADLAKMPHLLIAGATGSGKSVAVNSIISCLLMQNTPEEVRMVLVDPKRVELTPFADIPHLAFSHVVTDMDEVVGTLQAVIYEMESRYRKFTKVGARNIEGYNKSPRTTAKMPYWVVVIDELADLMIVASYEVERQICRLAQLARATGIHLIIATQRPSVDVVTGLIKANFPTRIAFAVSSQVDSRTILDGAGAEKLLGKGDMLFQATDAAKPKRLQGSFVSDREIDLIVEWWKNDRFRHLRPSHLDHLIQEAADESLEGEDTVTVEEDSLLEAATELALQHSRISTSLLQRRLHVGYPRAARLIDMLEQEGVVGKAEGQGQSRRVLATSEAVEDDLFGQVEDARRRS